MMKMKNESVMIPSEIGLPLKQQQIFRGLLDAFSYPGRITICAEQNTPAWLAILSALVDGETNLADPEQLLPAELWQALEVRRAIPEKAAYILLDGSKAPVILPQLGTLEAPEGGATILLIVTSLRVVNVGGLRLKLTGPGIKEFTYVNVDGLNPAWIESRNEWVSAFPLGVEMILSDANQFVALPRSTRIHLEEAA
jgi:alpha-D-ribose 1-methylphosphonate 5-triphosphate synthase subunit PhnH